MYVSGDLVWAEGQFVAGVTGITAGVATGGADSRSVVEFRLGSGSYAFVVLGLQQGSN